MTLATNLCHYDELFARKVELFDRLSKDNFCEAVRIDLRGHNH